MRQVHEKSGVFRWARRKRGFEGRPFSPLRANGVVACQA